MEEHTKNEIQIIGGGIVWFAILLTGITSLTVIAGCLYLLVLGSLMYNYKIKMMQVHQWLVEEC